MSLVHNQAGAWVPTGNPETSVNESAIHAAGQLGQIIEYVRSPGVVVRYQLVKFKTTITYASGEILYWDDYANKIVTNVATNLNVAGFVPNGGLGVASAYATVPTGGNYGWIVKHGLVPVKFLDSPTVAPDDASKQVVPVAATAGRVDCVNAAASVLPPVGRTHGAQDGTTKLGLAYVSVVD